MSSSPFKSPSQSPLHNFSISESNWSTNQQPGQRITEPLSPQPARELEENSNSSDSKCVRKSKSARTEFGDKNLSNRLNCLRPRSNQVEVPQEHDEDEELKTWNWRPRKGKTPTSHRDHNEVERPEFSVALTQKEIEEDIIAMTGSRPTRKPRRRPKAVQERLNKLLPGSLLGSITLDSYKISEDSYRDD